MSSRYILGVDLSSTITGYALYDTHSKKIVKSGVIRLPKWKLENMWDIRNLLTTTLRGSYRQYINICDSVEIVIEVSDFKDASTTMRFYRMLGWLEQFVIEKIKAITPNEWRRFYLDGVVDNWRQTLKREVLKDWAMKMVKTMTGIECETDDEAEAILIAMVGQNTIHMEKIKEDNVLMKKENKVLQKKKKNARLIVKKLKEKKVLTEAEKNKLEKNKEITKRKRNE